jgi:hypothetical protein
VRKKRRRRKKMFFGLSLVESVESDIPVVFFENIPRGIRRSHFYSRLEARAHHRIIFFDVESSLSMNICIYICNCKTAATLERGTALMYSMYCGTGVES